VKFLKINIADILTEPGLSRSFEGSLTPGDISWQGETIRFKEPLYVTGKVTNSGTVLILTAEVRSRIILQCGSCLEDYEQNLDFSFEARLVRSSEDDNPDLFVFEGNEIDLSEIVWEFLILEIPIKRRCREHCKGLCPNCGTNLNYKTCSCANIEENDDPDLAFDERLKVLKDFFSTEGKEV